MKIGEHFVRIGMAEKPTEQACNKTRRRERIGVGDLGITRALKAT